MPKAFKVTLEISTDNDVSEMEIENTFRSLLFFNDQTVEEEAIITLDGYQVEGVE